MHNNIAIVAASVATEASVNAARPGMRFGRMDLASRLAVQAVEALGIDFESLPRDRVGICLGTPAGSLATDLDFWNGRNAVGGPSPTIFAYTLPNAAIGEIAIRHRLTGVNLCLVGDDMILAEARDLLARGEVDACLCIYSNVVSPALAELIQVPPAARACALFLRRGGEGWRELRENDRDIASVCAAFCEKNSA